MRIATWNVNSVRQRVEHLLTWLKDCSPDVVCLQEIKCVDDAFPRLEIEATTSSPPARKPSTALRCCRSCRSMKPSRGSRATTRTRMRGFWKAWSR
jgi:hypothetical protein